MHIFYFIYIYIYSLIIVQDNKLITINLCYKNFNNILDSSN